MLIIAGWSPHWPPAPRHWEVDRIQDVHAGSPLLWSSGLCLHDVQWAGIQSGSWETSQYWCSSQSQVHSCSFCWTYKVKIKSNLVIHCVLIFASGFWIILWVLEPTFLMLEESHHSFGYLKSEKRWWSFMNEHQELECTPHILDQEVYIRFEKKSMRILNSYNLF